MTPLEFPLASQLHLKRPLKDDLYINNETHVLSQDGLSHPGDDSVSQLLSLPKFTVSFLQIKHCFYL